MHATTCMHATDCMHTTEFRPNLYLGLLLYGTSALQHLQVHLYGTTTNREHSRRRWKWYPGWENDKNEIEYKKTQLGTGKPALCEIPKSEVIVAFEKLTLHSALPTDIVSATNRFTLGNAVIFWKISMFLREERQRFLQRSDSIH